MKKIIDDAFIFDFQFGFMNFYMVKTRDGFMMIDTGISGSMVQQALDQAAQQGIQAHDIHHIFITHAHYDHVGGLAHLQKQTNAQTYAHQRETAIIRGEKAALFAADEALSFFGRIIKNSMKDRVNATPARVDTEVKQDELILDEFKVIELPGHAYGQIGLWWEKKGILFGGDVVVRLPWGLTTPVAAATPDMPEAKRSITKAAALKPEILCIGHGRPIQKDAHNVLKQYADKINST